MKPQVWTTSHENRRSFIGGSDALVIMGRNEAALIQLWREKRGEAQAEDLSGNLIVQLGGRHRGAQPVLVPSATRAGASQMSSASSSIQPFPGWRRPSTASWREQKRSSKPNSCCRGPSPRRQRRKSTWLRSNTTCGSPTCAPRFSRLSPAAANGWKSRFPWTHPGARRHCAKSRSADR
jgi:hypothetical protein